MAGSKTFLQPILNEVVGDIGTNVQALNESMGAVKNSVDNININVPPKIDEQIEELQEVVKAIGATAVNVNITKNNPDKFIELGENQTKAIHADHADAGDVVLATFTLKSTANGTLALADLFSHIAYDYTFFENWYGTTVTATLDVKIEITEDGAALTNYTRNLVSQSVGFNQTKHWTGQGIDSDTYISIKKDSVYVIKLTATTSKNGKRDVTLTLTKPFFTVGYALANTTANPIEVL